jgi:hypothetical protein
MNLYTKIVFLIGICCLSLIQSSLAQFIQELHPPISKNGTSLNLAWLGGLNSPQFSSIDANNDNIQDLFIYDRTSEKSFIIICDVNGNLISQDKTQAATIPALREWAMMRDYNCDGLPDVFSYGNGGIKVHKNIGTPTLWKFELTTNDLQSFSEFSNNSYFSSLYVSSVDLPLIEDLDNDGDLDVLTFGLNGDKIEYHKNLSTEFNGTCDSLHFALKNKCWGYIAEANFDNVLTLGSSDCPFNVVNPERRKTFPEFHEYEQKKFVSSRHSGSTITNISDGNSLSKLLIGDVSYNSLTQVDIVKNSINRDSVTDAFYNSPTNNPIDITTFPAGFVINRNNVGNELLISPFALSGTANQNSVWRFSQTNGNWTLEEQDFIQNETLDVGADAIPVWHDMNQDGVMDIIIGNSNSFKQNNEFGNLTVLTNVGTNVNPDFNISDEDFLNLKSLQLENLYPTFGDLTGDDRDELIIGTKDGFLLYYTNNGNIAEEFTLSQTQLLDNENQIIDVGLFAAPCLVDINQDNLLDLLIGNRNGKLVYYQNIGTVNAPSFQFITNNYTNINVTPALEINGYSTPRVSLINNQPLLMVGNSAGNIFWFDSLTGNQAIPNSDYPSNFNSGRRSTISAYSNSNLLHTLIGNKGGGLNYFILNLNQLSVEQLTTVDINLYPNPASESITISGQHAKSNLAIQDLTGKTILNKTLNTSNEEIDISSLPNGIYFAVISNASQKTMIKLIKT